MLTNLHTHTTFCDGKNTPEEVVLAAIEEGFASLGFSGHGYMPFDQCYCTRDTAGYIAEVKRLRECYKDQIQIYLGIEEDRLCLTNREDFDYIIGSSHYCMINGQWYSVDGSPDGFEKLLKQFGGDLLKMAKAYYEPFCDYIKKRKPDIVGHFDLITKFAESHYVELFDNKDYHHLAEQYICDAASSGCLFEVNTGAISRGYRTTPYPHENLLQVLRKNGTGLVLTSDSHSKDTLSFRFGETRNYLKELGFDYVYRMQNGEFVKDYL